MTESLLPKTYDYRQIDSMIGFGLLRADGFRVEHFQISDVAALDDFADPNEDPEDIERELDHRVRELAECGREEALGRYFPNDFRYVSRIQRDGPGNYWFEIALTESGERALVCSTNAWCCDQNGYFNEEATVRFYLERVSALHLTAIEFNQDFEYRDVKKWIDEPWAHKIKTAYQYYGSGIKPLRTGLPDYEATVKTWYYHLVQNGLMTHAPDKIRTWRAKGYCREWQHEKWAQPLMKALALSEKLIRANSEGEPDYDATVRYWLNSPTDEIVKFKNILLGLNDGWAQPIQDRLMTILMTQRKVSIFS